MLRKNIPNKKHSIIEHGKYGIYKWFLSKGVSDEKDMFAYINDFLTYKKFDCSKLPTKGAKKSAMVNYIQNRFISEFCPYVLKKMRN